MSSKWAKTEEVGIYKREGVGTPWLYARYEVHGKPRWKILPTAKVREAASMRKKIIRALREKPFVDLDKLLRGESVATASDGATVVAPPPVTIGKLIARYEEDAVIEAKKANVRALRRVLQLAGVREPDAAPWTVISRETVAAYVLRAEKAAAVIARGDPARGVSPDNFKAVRARRSASSILRQARSVFARKLQPAYREIGLGDISGFFEGDVSAPQVVYEVPPRAILERIAAGYRNLKAIDPAAYAGFLVGLGLGLRNSEAAIARFDWIEQDRGLAWLRVTLRADSKTKTERSRWVEVPAFVLAELEALRGTMVWHGSGEKDDAGAYKQIQVETEREYLIPGTSRSDRYNAITRRLAKWLRDQGLDAQRYPKAYYELRKLLGSIVAKREKSITAAAQALGNLPTTAERYYVGVLRGPSPLDILGPATDDPAQAKPA